MASALSEWVKEMSAGRSSPLVGKSREATDELLNRLYAERAHNGASYRARYQWRVNLQKAEDAASYAGMITMPNQTSQNYQGTSLVWFPATQGSLLVLVIGTEGFGADQDLLGRPGHSRRLRALGRLHGNRVWVKPDLLDLGFRIADSQWEQWALDLDTARRTYEQFIYAAVPIRSEADSEVATDLLDFFLTEHRTPLTAKPKERWEKRLVELRGRVLEPINEKAVKAALTDRRFVVLEGPPGTGKTRLARHLAGKNSTTIQFHPARTYEDFVVGLYPQPTAQGLAFEVKAGDLLRANEAAGRSNGDHILVIDEINRADLARVLGEAIYLFEPGEPDRSVRLPHTPKGFAADFQLSPNLKVLATRNTSDRTIARMDVAIRRRFSFFTVWPDSRPVEAQKDELAIRCFNDCLDVFTEYADEETLRLLPGHAYFLDPSASENGRAERIRARLEHELLPLLRDYLSERLCGAADREVAALVDRIEARIAAANAQN